MATSTATPHGRTFQYTQNLYFQDGIGFSAVLVGLLYLLVAASLDSAGYIPSMGILYPVTLGAIGVSLLMAYSRFDSFFAFSHGMFTGLAWILFLMRDVVTAAESRSFVEFGFPEMQAKVYFVLYRLLKWVELAWVGQAAADNYMFIFEICLLVWWLAYLGIWSIFRHGYTWRAIMPAGVVLLINTYYAPQSVTGFLFVFAFVALIVLVRTHLAEQQLRWRFQRIYFSQDITLDFLRTSLLYSVCVLVIAWIAPGLGRSGPVRDILRPLNEMYVEMNQRVNDYYPSLARQQRSGGSAFGRSLELGGERNVGSELIFTAATPLGRYWRAVVFDTFDGRGWQNTNETSAEFEAEVPLPVGNWQMRESITQTIQLMAATGDVIFGAPDIYRVTVPLDAQVEPAPAESLIGSAGNGEQGTTQAIDFTYLRSRQTLDVGDSYSVVSRQTVVTQQALENAGTDYPQSIVDKYLQLPENFSTRVSDLALMITEVYPTPYAKAKALETYLRGIKYNDAIAAPPDDVDPLEYFLFDIQEGYCDYYASALATMLRSVGIPARTASGYAEGTYDQESNLYAISAADAHTWVEVYFPTYGWIEFEPTAGESALNRPSEAEDAATEEGALDASDTITNSVPPSQPQADDPLNQFEDGLPPDGFTNPNEGGVRSWPWWVWAIVTPLLVVGGAWGIWRMTLWGPTSFTPELPPILLERIHRWAERLGLRLPAHETPYEHEQRLGRALPESQPFVRPIIQTYVRYRFSREAGETSSLSAEERQQEEDLGQTWQSLERVFWKTWLRNLYSNWRRPAAARK